MGVFANALRIGLNRAPSAQMAKGRSGLGMWLLERFHRRASGDRRLALVDRISLAPRQTVALVEADGQRLLVATAGDGAPVFYPLASSPARKGAHGARKTSSHGDRA